MGRELCPAGDGPVGSEVPVDDVVPREGSSFGTSSGQYQPGIAWKPEEEDMFGGE